MRLVLIIPKFCNEFDTEGKAVLNSREFIILSKEERVDDKFDKKVSIT